MPSELKYLSRPMIELRRVQGADDSDGVHDFGSVGQKTGKPCARLAVLLELPRRLLQFRCSPDESEALTIDQTFRNRFLIAFTQCGLVIEHINVRYAAGLIQIDDALRFGREIKCMNAQTPGLVFSLSESAFA